MVAAEDSSNFRVSDLGTAIRQVSGSGEAKLSLGTLQIQ